MLSRFSGDTGRRLRIEALKAQKLVGGNQEIAEQLAELVELHEVKQGSSLMKQNDFSNDIYFILSGAFGVRVEGRLVANLGPNDHVGEMVVIEPSQKRSATVTASEDSVVASIDEPRFDELGQKYPMLFKSLARELARRLLQHNKQVKPTHDRIRIFVISSTKAIPVARLVHNGLKNDPFEVIVWNEGTFKASNYLLQTLEDEIDQCDFAVAIAHPDDVTEVQDTRWPVPRDNVIFELGLFMGRLGKSRAILMEPRDENVKLPSDLAGLVTICYRHIEGKDAGSHFAPAVNQLRTHFEMLGPNN